MKSAVILTSSLNDCIGRNNSLPWNIPIDLKRFKSITSKNENNIVIMGRKTYDSIGKPLPGRINYVLTKDLKAAKKISATIFGSLDKAIEDILWWEEFLNIEFNVFFIGGSNIFEEALRHYKVNTIYHTLVHDNTEGDTFFKVPDWNVIEQEEILPSAKNKYKITFRKLIRPNI